MSAFACVGPRLIYFLKLSNLYHFDARGPAAVRNTASFIASSSFRDVQRVGIFAAIRTTAPAAIIN
jgi:hypothetical protein